jgi:UDP-N-acetylmuramate dehydrogenase
MQILEQHELRPYNSFQVAARARWFATAGSSDELAALLQWAREQQLPFMVLGQGSNILLRGDYPGLVILMQLRGRRILADSAAGVEVEAMGGENWHDFVQWSLQQGCCGLENLSLIPGTVGAAPVQNIGAYGVELKDHLLSLEAMDSHSGELRHFSKADCGFAYRDSVFKATAGRYIICSVRFLLSRQPQLKLDYPALQQALAGQDAATLTPQQVSAAVCAIRRSKLPDPAQCRFLLPQSAHQPRAVPAPAAAMAATARPCRWQWREDSGSLAYRAGRLEGPA